MIRDRIPGKKVKRALRQSVWEGGFSSAMIGFGESFYSAFAVLLKATDLQIGLLGSLPQLLGSLAQLCNERLLRLFGTRKRLVATGVLLQALMLIPIMLVFLAKEFSVVLLLVFASLYWIFGMVVNPAWSSWMGDLVETHERGLYFGMRSSIGNIVSFAAMLFAGLTLQYFQSDAALIGFIIIFSLAMASRLLSFTMLLWQHEPAYSPPTEQHRFTDFVKGASSTNYGLLVLFLSAMNGAVAIAGPYFTVYMLRDLRFDYGAYTLLIGAAVITKYLFMPMWGKAADKYGTRKVLILGAAMLPLVSLVWVFSTSFWWLVAAQVYSGFVWASIDLSSFNALLDATEPRRRSAYLSYYNVINGCFVFAGTAIGALLIWQNHLFWSSIVLVFIVSSVARALVAALFAYRLKEVRTVERIGYRDLLFDVLSIQPNMGIRHQVTLINQEIVKPLNLRFRRIGRRAQQLLMRPLAPVVEPIIQPIGRLGEPVITFVIKEPMVIVKDATAFPATVVKRTTRTVRTAARWRTAEVVRGAARLEDEVGRVAHNVTRNIIAARPADRPSRRPSRQRRKRREKR